MYLRQQYELNENTNGFEVSGDNLPAISSSDYWACNATSRQVSHTSSLTEEIPNATLQKLPLQSSLNYPTTLLYSGEQQIPQFSQHLTYGNLISPSNKELNRNWTLQTPSETESYLISSSEKSSSESNLDYQRSSSQIGQQQIPLFDTSSGNSSLLNDNDSNCTPVCEESPQTHIDFSNGDFPLSDFNQAITSSNVRHQYLMTHDFQHTSNENLILTNINVNTFNNGAQILQAPQQVEAYLNASNEKILFESNLNYLNPSSEVVQYQMPQMNQQTTNGNIIPPNNILWGRTRVLQAPQQIEAHLDTSDEKLLFESNLNYLNPSSEAEQHQITQFNQHTTNGNIISPNNIPTNRIQVSQAPLQAESYLYYNNKKVLPESNLNYQQLQISQSNQNADSRNTIMKNNSEWYETKVFQQLPETQPYLNSGNKESSSIPCFNHANTVSYIGQQQILPCYQRTFNENFILTNNNVPTGTQVSQVPIRPPQYLRSSYQSNKPSNMSADTKAISRRSNSVMSSYQFNQLTNEPSKPHVAQITFAKTTSGVLRRNPKMKRKRTMFTTEQVAILENVFSKKPYVNREDRLALENQLHINDKTIKVWFQNRRLKDKRAAAELDQEMYSPDSSIADTPQETSCFARFDNFSCKESLMTKTNKNGFLSLDDHSKELNSLSVNNCINNENILQKAIQLSDLKSIQSETEWSTMYEPISPAATDTPPMNEPFMTQDLLKPEESLQQLLDLQSILNSDYSS